MEEATVSEHKNGKGYTLQISPDNYFAYVYIKDTPNDGVTKAELTYTAGGKTETLTDDVYPFEFIVKVDNPDVAFNYIIKAEGEEYGRGTLLTRALSEEKGIKEPLNKTNFALVAVKGITDIDTNGQGLITAVGMPTNGENAHPDRQMKICLNPALVTESLGNFATAYDETGLEGCYLVGYLTMRKNNSGSFKNLDTDAKIFMQNIPIVGYDISPNPSRIDLVTGGDLKIISTDPRYKDANGSFSIDSDGEYLVNPYEYYADHYLYLWKNVYLVNSKTDLSIKAVKGDGKYTLITGGCHVVDIFIVTLDEEGKRITDTTCMNEQILMFNNPIEIPLEANQKAFVWNTRMYEGTTMSPVLEPLVGSDFSN